MDFFQKYVTESQNKMKSIEFCDFTLVSDDGEQAKAHKVILASSSTFFREIFKNKMHSHPFIFMRGTKGNIQISLVDFIYCGETSFESDNVEDVIKLITELNMNPTPDDKTIKILNSQKKDANKKQVKDTYANYGTEDFVGMVPSVKCTIAH